ncbi:glycoside hydrolase family 27 protein [candidate division KSB1 bacterium]|nr:glycoside hydrolase family 27 protein [candidate division KSB1 bacterium]
MKIKPKMLLVMLNLMIKVISPPVYSQTCIQDFTTNPPLGFNSFDSYRTNLTEEKAYALMDVMAEKYLPFGYEYFVMDAGWYNTMRPEKHQGLEPESFGLWVVRQDYFPHGIKVLAEYAHKKGLKFGVWLMRGIPREAVKRNLPIPGTPFFSRDIADTSSICGWSQSNYGVDMTKPGAQNYYNAIIDTLASWGIDFIKVDDMVPNPYEIIAIAKSIEQGSHTMIYSLSPGDVHHPTHLPYYKRANMLRITRDIWDNPLSIEKGFSAWDKFQGISGPGFWPDMDMIPFGRLDVVNQQARQSLFSQDQKKTFIAQRALAASPLFIGGDLLTMDDFSYSLLTNREMLACNQNGVMGVNVYRAGNIDVWLTPHKMDPCMGWIGIFNRSKSNRKVTLTKQDLGFVVFEASYNLKENKNATRFIFYIKHRGSALLMRNVTYIESIQEFRSGHVYVEICAVPGCYLPCTNYRSHRFK